jgi:protein Tex
MIEFSKQISEKWSISQTLAELLCNSYLKNDTPYYLAEYTTEVAVELPVSAVWEIYDFLKTMDDLSSKKKRVLNAYKKIGKCTSLLEKQINLKTNPYELDDMLIPFRPNPRSKGQLAAKKGIGPFTDLLLKQEEEQVPVEKLAEEYVGKDPSLKTADDVLQGVKEILAERFAYDDTVRSMARDFAFEDGFFDVTPKNKKDPRFISYIGKSIPLHELSQQELLILFSAEDNKEVRLKLGVQLFRVTELLRHHFITNPDFVGFDLLCATIDDSWERLLQPIIERDVKDRLRNEAEEWAVKQMTADIEKAYAKEQERGPVLCIDIYQKKSLLLLAINGQGSLLGATSEKVPADIKTFISERLRQFLVRHRPSSIVVRDTDQVPQIESMLKPYSSLTEQPIPFIKFKDDPEKKNASQSEWMLKKFSALLDEPMRDLYGFALKYLQPISLVTSIGPEYLTVHPFQNIVAPARCTEVISRIISDTEVRKGVLIKDITESPFVQFCCIKPGILQAIKAADTKEQFTGKNDLLKVDGMTESVFRNIAGFIVIPNGNEPLDRSLVHPDFYGLINEVSEQLTVSQDTIVSDPEILRSYATEDFVRKIYIEKKLIGQVQSAQQYFSQVTSKAKHKLKLTEIKEGSIVSGRVTNITPFGVFVNINAVCDGLIHISQLADEYVETPEQVVAINDKVDVRILKVDVKKRRISLSMKNLGNKAPHVKPTKGQLDNLAEYFKNR